MSKDELLDKCIQFSIKINKLRKYLREKQHEFNNSDQIQRAGTSIGANISEALCGQSKKDFYAKMYIAYKESSETAYWIDMLYENVEEALEYSNERRTKKSKSLKLCCNNCL